MQQLQGRWLFHLYMEMKHGPQIYSQWYCGLTVLFPAGLCALHVLDHSSGCFLSKPGVFLCALFCKYTATHLATLHYMYSSSKYFFYHVLFFVSGLCRIRCWATVLWFSDQCLGSLHHPAASSSGESHAGLKHC